MRKSNTLLSLILFVFITIGANSQCVTPTNLQAVYSNSNASFTWDAVPGAVSYTIDFKYPAYSWDNIEYSEVLTTNSFFIPEILQSVTVDWRVVANCGINGSSGFNQATLAVPCDLPTSPNTTNITTNSATINWSHPTGTLNNTPYYRYAYRPAGIGASWIPLQGGSQVLSFNITNLTAGTTYEWCVNQDCSYFDSNPVISTFTTQAAPCGIASLWLPNQITSTQANLRWVAVPNAIDYIVEYKPTSSQNWVTINSALVEKLVIGLSPATQYDWRIKAICPSNNIGNYSGIGQFTTAVVVAPPTSCGVPSGFFMTNIGNRSATFNWSPVANATSYTLNYKVSTNAGWLTINGIIGNNFTRTNLQIGSNYIYKVRAVCSNGTSVFSPDQNFSTLNCVSAGNNTNEWIDLFAIGSINRVSGAEPGGYLNTGLSANLTIGSTNNTGQISAGFASNQRNQNYSVYIDFNRNGNYNDAGERVFGIGGLNNAGIFNFAVSIPANATPGPAGLRVVMSKNGQPANGPCLENFEGKTEDYIVNLVAPSSRISAHNETVKAEHPENLVAYPNPSNGNYRVKIPFDFKAEAYQILNMTGKVLQNNKVNEPSSIELNISNEPSGLYILNIKEKSGKQINTKLWKY